MQFTSNQPNGRRSFLKLASAAGAVVTAASAGLVRPVRAALGAAWPKEAFNTEGMDQAMKTALGTTNLQDGDVTLDAPTIAENGAVVPITISSGRNDIETMHVFVEENPAPYVARFHLDQSPRKEVSTRIKMGQTSNVIAVAQAKDGTAYQTRKEVRVTIGGCGG
jgi:sulfur-oxidizing protein SoxY